MKRKIRNAVIAFFVIIVMVVIVMLLNPLRRSEEKIRESILELTPIGTSMEDVVKVVENNEKWEIRSVRATGYLLINGEPSFPYVSPIAESNYEYEHPIIGEKSIRVHLGEYRTVFAVDVSAYFGFDEDSKLIDIAVIKDMDAM